MSSRLQIRPVWVALAAWLASGLLARGCDASEKQAPADRARNPVSVVVRVSNIETVWREVEHNGRTAPDRAATLRAQTATTACLQLRQAAGVLDFNELARINARSAALKDGVASAPAAQSLPGLVCLTLRDVKIGRPARRVRPDSLGGCAVGTV